MNAHLETQPPDSAAPTTPPGVVINHLPTSGGVYVGSPSLAVLPDGTYVASHDLFGPKSTEHEAGVTLVFRSRDRGETWTPLSRVEPAFWSSLFVHRDHLYLFGTTRHHGALVIRRSDDGGRTWTEPRDAASGLLTESGEYHTAPVPFVVEGGRLWRAVEDAGNGTNWGERYRPMILSANAGADLLRRESWRFSNFLTHDPGWLGGMGAWLEGNAVPKPGGGVVNILRVDHAPGGKAALAEVTGDGARIAFDPESGFLEFPGGPTKFTIRPDPRGGGYWALVNDVPPRHAGKNAALIRNTLSLLHSADLRRWEVRTVLLYHPDAERHGFQYADWLFDGDDLVAAIRTAHDDAHGGAHKAHDANYLTFHRFANFRRLTLADSPVDPLHLQTPNPPSL